MLAEVSFKLLWENVKFSCYICHHTRRWSAFDEYQQFHDQCMHDFKIFIENKISSYRENWMDNEFSCTPPKFAETILP